MPTHTTTPTKDNLDTPAKSQLMPDQPIPRHHQRKLSALQLPSPVMDGCQDGGEQLGYCENKFDGKPQQMAQVAAAIKEKHFLPDDLVDVEVAWFYGNLGIDDMYFATESVDTIAGHIMGLYAAKMSAYVKDSDCLHVNLEQEVDNGALYIHNSRPGVSQLAGVNYEERIDDRYLDLSRPDKAFRLETYRSSGTVSSSLKTQLRCYFVRQCEFVDPLAGKNCTDITKVSDKAFLQKATKNTLDVYQSIMKMALQRPGPVIDMKDLGREKRLVIGYRQGGTNRFFSALSHLYHYYGLYSTRKYVENFSNGVTILCVYLAPVSHHSSNTNSTTSKYPPIDHSIVQIMREASLIYCLPKSPLQGLFASGQLSIQEAVYGYAGLVFAQHFLNRLGSEYTALSTILDIRSNPQHADVMARLKKRLRQETFTREYILELAKQHPELIRQLFVHFAAVHYLPHRREGLMADGAAGLTSARSLSYQRLEVERVPETEELKERIKKTVSNAHEMVVFEAFLTFNQSILKTNFFLPTKVALSFRLSCDFLLPQEYPNKPFGLFLIIGSEFRGFHVRFRDIARGGIRIIRSRNREAYSINLRTLFDENYALAATQQRKNKDIPEGGSKGTILLDVDEQDKAQGAFEKYVDAILDVILVNPLNRFVDRLGQPEILFFGPDEGTADFMDWASQHARQRGASFWNAFTTGKSPSLGGIPHDTFGMTTRSIHKFVLGIYGKLNLQEQQVTKVQTGGPDGDLGSNEIKISSDKTTAIIDGSGVLYDPMGINREELVRIATLRKPISAFNVKLLSKDGFRVLVEESNVVLPSGEVVDNGATFRNSFHLHPLFQADLFVPCGGRPEAVDIMNVAQLLPPQSPSLKFKYVVEGANLFFTQEARLAMEQAGVIIFKDASANKGGVTSSSMEVLAALCMDEEQFAANMMCRGEGDQGKPLFYKQYVEAVQKAIELNAELEFECLWREKERTGKPLSILSDDLSTSIVDLRSKLSESTELWEDRQLRDCVLKRAIPTILQQLVPLTDIYSRVPEPYLRALFAAHLASRYVYEFGVQPDQFAFYQFMKRLRCM